MPYIRNNSRLRFSNFLTSDEAEFWDIPDEADLSPRPGDLFHVVEGGQTIDWIANNYYGDPVLWWVIAQANSLEILPTDLNRGDTIRIPSPTYIQSSSFRPLGK